MSEPIFKCPKCHENVGLAVCHENDDDGDVTYIYGHVCDDGKFDVQITAIVTPEILMNVPRELK